MMTVIQSGRSDMIGDWRFVLAVTLLILAAVPVQIYAVSGFEITPSLVLAAAALVLFDPKEKLHRAVIAFMAFCGVLALLGMYDSRWATRNIIGAISYTSGAPYIFVGMLIARRGYSLSRLLQVISPVAAAMVAILLIDLYLNNGNTVFNGKYESTSYAAAETVYVRSFFPFYGTYAVITLATIVMMIGALSLGALESFETPWMKLIILLCSSTLLFIAFSMWTRQVMIGVIGFYISLVVLSPRRASVWASLVIFLILFSPLAYSVYKVETGNQDYVRVDEAADVASGIAVYKLERATRNIETGNLNDLSTGRMAIYRNALDRLTPRIFVMGCGFCNLKSVLNFNFSSLHNVPLNAIYKGGVVYAVIYIGAAFFGLIALWPMKDTLAGSVTIATLASLALQSMVNDVLYFQVVPAILFTITGFLVVSRRRKNQ